MTSAAISGHCCSLGRVVHSCVLIILPFVLGNGYLYLLKVTFSSCPCGWVRPWQLSHQLNASRSIVCNFHLTGLKENRLSWLSLFPFPWLEQRWAPKSSFRCAGEDRALQWCFSNFSVLYNHLGLAQNASSHPQNFKFCRCGVGPGTSISNKFHSNNVVLLVLGPHFENHSRRIWWSSEMERLATQWLGGAGLLQRQLLLLGCYVRDQ